MYLSHQHPLSSIYATASENPFSPSVLGKKFKRLRLRPSPPTPGEKSLRLQWQKNSAFCNSLTRGHRNAVSAPPVTRATSKCMNIRNTNLRINVQNSELEYLQRKAASSATSVQDKTRSLNNVSAYSRKSPSSILQLRHSPGRSQSFVDCIRPSTSHRVTSESDPCSPFSTGRKSVKTHMELMDKFKSNLFLEEPPIDNELKREFRTSSLQRETFSSDSKKQNDIKREIATCDASFSTNRDRFVKKSDNSVVPINMSKQLIRVRARGPSESSVRHGFIRIKSLHKKADEKSKTNSNKDETREQSVARSTPRPSACRDVTVPLNILRRRHRELNARGDPPQLEIRHIKAPADRESSQSRSQEELSPTCPNISQPYLCSKTQLRIKKVVRQENTTERKSELCRKHSEISSIAEKQLIVPNPSLVDFGKRTGFPGTEDDVRINNIYETDQDPATMLRILSWLENVENSSDFYYGFDENKLK